MGKLNVYSLLVCAVATFTPLPAAGQILPPGASVERLAKGYSFTEGPVYDGNGSLYFTNLFFSATPSQIIRYDDSTGTTEVVDRNSGQANGLFFDHNGQIVSMDMGSDRRQVSRRAADDISIVEEVLATEWNGIQFNSTNDLVIAQDGGIYFSDPDYLGRKSQPDAVYYLNPDGELTQIMSGLRRPNGLILSPDGQTLYLAVEGERRIMAYDVGADGLPSNEREFAKTKGGPDGMTVDSAGNVYAAVANAVSAWDPTGQPLFDLSVPERASNVTFGGADGKTLFITASSSLYGIELNIVPELGIDALSREVLAGTNNPQFDLTGEGLVDEADRDYWVTELNNTYFGDSNLDGEFNSTDLVGVLAAGTFEADIDSEWSTGDFSGDARTNSADLVVALAGGGFGLGPRTAVSAVPEPASFVMLMAGLIGIAIRRRRFGR